MSDPQIALLMLGLFLFAVFLGFPIAFTLMAMGIGFGYYAYFDADRMWRAHTRALEAGADTWTSLSTWFEGLLNNRIFDLFVNQTFSVWDSQKPTTSSGSPVRAIAFASPIALSAILQRRGKNAKPGETSKAGGR